MQMGYDNDACYGVRIGKALVFFDVGMMSFFFLPRPNCLYENGFGRFSMKN